ncbi:MAG: hypothetical protein ACOY94_06080 [Bacillota bacterium]
MLVLKINYTTSLDRAAKSVRYHAFRSRELPAEGKGIFDRTSDHADVGRFVRSLDDPLTQDRVTRRGRVIPTAKLHRLMFSLSRREFESCGFTSWKPVIREALEHFERYHGIKLEWVAAEHQSATHPHVHVDIKSVYTAADGTRHRLVITNEMRKHLRWAVEGVMKRERTRYQEERRQHKAFDRAVRDLTVDLTRGLLKGLRDATREDGPDPLGKQNRRRRRPERDDERDDRSR